MPNSNELDFNVAHPTKVELNNKFNELSEYWRFHIPFDIPVLKSNPLSLECTGHFQRHSIRTLAAGDNDKLVILDMSKPTPTGF